MSRFRIMTEKYNWTIDDKESNDITVFLSNHFYKSPTTTNNFLVIDKALISINKIIAIEEIKG